VQCSVCRVVYVWPPIRVALPLNLCPGFKRCPRRDPTSARAVFVVFSQGVCLLGGRLGRGPEAQQQGVQWMVRAAAMGDEHAKAFVIGLRQRGCVTTDQPETPGVAAWRVPVERDFTLLGMPRVQLAYEATGTDIQLNSRLWDVAPDGTQTLVTRAAYRVVAPGSGEQRAAYDLYGNHWHLERGHELLLEVTGDDSTFFRRDNFPSVTTVTSAKLTLPGIE